MGQELAWSGFKIASSMAESAVDDAYKGPWKTVKLEMRVEPKQFGEADDLPDVQEVRPTLGELHEDIAGSSVDTAHEVVDSDDEKAGSSVWEVRTSQTEATFIHTREMCPFHLFALEAKESAMKSVSAHGMNHLHCVKCYCYVCDAPASECKEWTGNSATAEAAHCNAFHSKTSEFWEQKRFFKRNKLVAFLARLTGDPYKAYVENKKVRDRIDRAWRLYEAGEVQTDGKVTTLNHKFTHVTGWFQKFFFTTRIVLDESEWASKFNTLDALTEVMIARTWRPPKFTSQNSVWDPDAEKLLDRIMLSLGSRWLTCFAKCDSANISELAAAVVERTAKLASVAKEVKLFDRGFSVLVDLSKTGLPGEELRVVKAVCNLYRSILKRRMHHVNLSATDTSAGPKYHEVRMKDSIMLPFLASLVDKAQEHLMETGRDTLKQAINLKALSSFYHHLTPETWDVLFAPNKLLGGTVVVSKDEIESAFKYVVKMSTAVYTYSTRLKLCSEQIVEKMLLFLHIATRVGDASELAMEAFKAVKDCMKLLEEKFTNTRSAKIDNYKWELCSRMCYAFQSITSHILTHYAEEDGPKGSPVFQSLFKLFKELEPNIISLFTAIWASKDLKYINPAPCVNANGGPSRTRETCLVELQKLGIAPSTKQGPTQILRTRQEESLRWVFARLHFTFDSTDATCFEMVKTMNQRIRSTFFGKKGNIYRAALKFNSKAKVEKAIDHVLSQKAALAANDAAFKASAMLPTGIKLLQAYRDCNALTHNASVRHVVGMMGFKADDADQLRQLHKRITALLNRHPTVCTKKPTTITKTEVSTAERFVKCPNKRSAEDSFEHPAEKRTRLTAVDAGRTGPSTTPGEVAERPERSSPRGTNMYEETFDAEDAASSLGLTVCCDDGTPVVIDISTAVRGKKNIFPGDIIHSINGKYINDLWRLLPQNLDRDAFMVPDPREGGRLVPSAFVVDQMMDKLSEFVKQQRRPLQIMLYKP